MSVLVQKHKDQIMLTYTHPDSGHTSSTVFRGCFTLEELSAAVNGAIYLEKLKKP